MDQAPRFAALTSAMIRRPRRALPLEPTVRAIAAQPGFREDVRFFVYAYAGALMVFLTWLA